MNTLKSICILLLLSSACTLNKKEDEKSTNSTYSEIYDNEVLVDSLMGRIVNNGDTSAYRELGSVYLLRERYQEWLYFAFVMAYDYNYAPAFYDIGYILNLEGDTNRVTNKIGNYYLFLSSKKGNEDARSKVEEKFGKDFKIPNTDDYLKSTKIFQDTTK